MRSRMKKKTKKKNITDRAHRYRANSAALRPNAPRVCAVKWNGKVCGSTRNVVPDHKNGNPADTRKANLRWACKSCNTRLGKLFAKKGKGRRTRQYNPGAKSLGEYVSAAVSHTRGASDEGGKIIHETPKARRREFAAEIWDKRRMHNPRKKKRKNGTPAEELYRKFHGRGPNKTDIILVTDIDPYAAHPEIAQLGKLLRLIVGEDIEMTGKNGDIAKSLGENAWAVVLDFRGKNAPDVAGAPNGRQIYFAGGDQNLDDHLATIGCDPDKDQCDLGFCYFLEYHTLKRFDQFQPVDYFHHLGEDTGVQPRLIYNRPAKLFQLVGGEYIITPRGIEN